MNLKDRIVELPPESFNSIIIGAKMTTKLKHNLLDSIPKELNHNCIFQARIVGSKIAVHKLT